MFIKCGCLNCGQNIEFSTDDFQEDHRTATAIFGQLVPCPSCATETRLFISQDVPNSRKNEESVSYWKRLATVGIVISVILICLALGWVFNKFGDEIARAVGSGIGMAILFAFAVFIIILSLFWLLFPIVMYFQLKRANELLAMVERNTRAVENKK